MAVWLSVGLNLINNRDFQIEELEDISDDMEFVEKLITEQSVFPLPAHVCVNSLI